MFSGMPAYQISVKWASNLLQGAHQLFSGFLPRPASFLFLYLVGMYVLLRILKIDPWLSLVGAVAFAFSTYFLILLPTGHTSKANAIGYMPLVLGGVWLLYRGRMLLGAALLALFLGLEITMNHVQVTYYLAMLLVLFALAELVRAVREKQVGDYAKRSGLGLLAVIFALLCNIGSLWSTWEYGRFSTRGTSELTIRSDGSSAADIRTTGLDRDYVTDYSFSVQETFNLLVPDAKGRPFRCDRNRPGSGRQVRPTLPAECLANEPLLGRSALRGRSHVCGRRSPCCSWYSCLHRPKGGLVGGSSQQCRCSCCSCGSPRQSLRSHCSRRTWSRASSSGAMAFP
jgi:hypothetical protein